MNKAIIGGIILGLFGFLAGVVGPLLFTQSNQGPLLGIFITGPLGFIIGIIGGYFRELFCKYQFTRGQNNVTEVYDGTPNRADLKFILIGMAILVVIVGYFVASFPSNAPSASSDETTQKIVRFTAVYDSVGIWNTALGGRLISLDPDTEYMQNEMYRKSIYFLSYPNETKFIGIGKPNLPAGVKVSELPKGQKVRIQGYYHTGYHRPTAEIVELIEQ